jgi:hypothetical protein
MKKLLLLALFAVATKTSFTQTTFDKIGYFGDYKAEWALVEEGGKQGFINKSGKVVVNPEYDKIGYFRDYKKNWALVEVDKNLVLSMTKANV